MENWNTCHILRYKVQAICTSGSCKDSSSIFLNCLHFTQSSSTSCVSMSLPFAWSSVKCIVNCNSSHAALFLKRWKYSLKLYQILMSRIMCSKLTACFCSITLKKKNWYAMRTCVCYLEMQRSLGKEGNARFANEGHLRFVSVTFGFHCGRWKARYVSELFSFA